MKEKFNPGRMLRSPRERLGGYSFLSRLMNKVRLHDKGVLPDEYHPNLLSQSERTFDGRFLQFTGISPEALKTAILSSKDDGVVLEWVRRNANPRSQEEIELWSDSCEKTLSIPTPERIAMRAGSYPKVAKDLGLFLLGSINPCDMIDFDEGRISEEEVRTRYEKCLRMESRPPFPPFTKETAMLKVRMAEDAWNSRSPERVAMAYTHDSVWRNRSEFFSGRPEIVLFLQRKWNKELDDRLIKDLWAFEGSRISVRFAYEWHDDSGQWYRSYGNENWMFSENGLMCRRIASINDLPISESSRMFHWKAGPRPLEHPGLEELHF